MKAIPTTYKGINFRSRLEARWAAFFDLLGWNWSYEAAEADGWIPDFSIETNYQPLLVEVKPTWQEPRDAIAKASHAIGGFDTTNLLCLGLGPFLNEQDEICIGWVNDFWPTDENFARAVIIEGTSPKWRYGLAADFEGSWEDRLVGNYEGDEQYRPIGNETYALWARATNTIQWFPKRRAAR